MNKEEFKKSAEVKMKTLEAKLGTFADRMEDAGQDVKEGLVEEYEILRRKHAALSGKMANIQDLGEEKWAEFLGEIDAAYESTKLNMAGFFSRMFY